MRRLFAAFVLASTVSLTAVIPSASAQGVGFFQPPFNTGLAGCTNLNGQNQALFPTLPQPVVGVQQCPLGFNQGLPFGFGGLNNGLGFGGTGQLSAQALPTNNGIGGFGGLGFGLGGLGLGGLGFGGLGGLNNGLGFGGLNNGLGFGGTGQLSAQALPTNNGIGGFGGLGFGLGGLGFGVTGGVNGFGTNCIGLGLGIC